MARYDYRCLVCDSSFEVRRGINENASTVVTCPVGHTETSRVFAAVAVNRGAAATSLRASVPAGGGGGCCGGACGCG